MRYLLHCIFRESSGPPPAECASGIRTFQAHGLVAAVTPYAPPSTELDIPRLLAYERLIARLHASRTIVPFRFGCVFGPSQIPGLLAERAGEYHTLLDRLEGRTEMGLRAFHRAPLPAEPPPAPGAQYLAAARRRCAGLTAREESWADWMCNSLAGGSALQRREARPAPEGRLVSLHFLLARAAAEDFRERARTMAPAVGGALLVTGPWPPYHFVDYAGC